MAIILNPFTGDFDFTGITAAPATPTNSFSTFQTPAGSSPVATSPTDTLTFVAGADISITGNAGTDTITIASTAVEALDLVSYSQYGGF
jgi:hypothetical protein